MGLLAFETAIKQIPGQTSGISLRYFYMLTGSDDYVKPDRMIKRFLQPIVGRNPGDDECQQLITAAAEILSLENKSITPRMLDNLIWKYQRIQAEPTRSLMQPAPADTVTFDELCIQAKSVLNPRRLSSEAEAGGVAAALLSESGKVYLGVCIDTACSMGFCAEHAAAAAMVTAGENRVTKMVAVNWNGIVLPPCGRCREFISQLHQDNLQADVMVAEDKVVILQDLLPFDWRVAVSN